MQKLYWNRYRNLTLQMRENLNNLLERIFIGNRKKKKIYNWILLKIKKHADFASEFWELKLEIWSLKSRQIFSKNEIV